MNFYVKIKTFTKLRKINKLSELKDDPTDLLQSFFFFKRCSRCCCCCFEDDSETAVKKLSLHTNIGVQASEDVWGRVGVKEGARFTRHTSIQMVAGMGSEILSEYLTKCEPFKSTLESRKRCFFNLVNIPKLF